MHENEILHIFDFNGYGQGVARSKEGKVVFIIDGIPGDSVRVKLIEEQKRYVTAKVKEIIESSDWREEPACQHILDCGGCQLQGIQPKHYMKAKKKILQAKFRGALAPFRDQVIIESPLFHFRNKCTLEWSSERKILSYADLKYNQFNLQQCIVVEQQIGEWVSNHHNITSQLPMSARITIKHLPDQGLVLGIQSKQPPLDLTLSEPFIAAYWIDFNKVESQGSLEWLSPPKATLLEKIDNLIIPWHPQSFFQTNRYIARKIFSLIKKWAIDLKIRSAWDLYCGTGWILHSIKDSLEFGFGFELSKHSINLAQSVANSSNLKFMNADLPRIPNVNAVIPDCWIFNPPRKGIGKKAIKSLFSKQLTPKFVIYMSCNPETLSTDLETLSKQGYSLERCQVFDMFPWTSHFEVLCLLRKSN